MVISLLLKVGLLVGHVKSYVGQPINFGIWEPQYSVYMSSKKEQSCQRRLKSHIHFKFS